jgi:glycerol-3-phosphate dehydrogenase (NAD(P)+)
MDLSVIGAGAWGTAFAFHLARKGHRVLLWVYEKELHEILVQTRENLFFLPGVTLPDAIRFTTSLGAAADFSEDLVAAPPSFALRAVLSGIGERLARKNLLILTKGLERGTLRRMSEVALEVSKGRSTVAVLSGPSFAEEVAHGAFTSVVIGSGDRGVATYFQSAVHSDDFRVYTTDDVVGVELGGALKNVMAIGSGILEGLGLGMNSQAAFLTRALAEMKRLGKASGTRETTFMGLSGVGDLILTCYGALSRNRRFGIDLSRGGSAARLIASQKTVVEGYYTIDAARRLAKNLTVDMPITEELYRIIYEDKPLEASISDLKQRAFKDEEA